MSPNRGKTSLKRKRRRGDPMQEYDRLPAELRTWVAAASLPWRPRSVLRTYRRALARTQDAATALQELDRVQDRLIAKDARKIWGREHPSAGQETRP